MTFQVWSATTTGPSHLSNNTPCQDACTVATSQDGIWTSIAVCDGCGSAEKADVGAQFASDFMSRALLALAQDVEEKGPGEWIIDKSVVLLSSLREKLRERFGEDITDYAATIVAALVSERGGFIIHIGDGIASSLTAEGGHQTQQLSVLTQSEPENGEYINQTFYLTEPNWIHHVRITALTGVECLVICTDGAQTLFYEGNKPYEKAFASVFRSLIQDPSNGNTFLKLAMSNQDADARSNDDKTIAIIARSGFLEAAAKIASTDRIEPVINNEPAMGATQFIDTDEIKLPSRLTKKGANLFFYVSLTLILTVVLATTAVSILLYRQGYFDKALAAVQSIVKKTLTDTPERKTNKHNVPVSPPTSKSSRPN